MTVTLAPRWALSGLAIHDPISGWLQDGVHLRTLVSPVLGFPLHPFLVYKLGAAETEHLGGSWVAENDQGDDLGPPPWNLVLGHPITATLLLTDAASWFVEVVGNGDLRVDVVVDGPAGQTVVSSRSAPPYEFGGCWISRLRISGSGSVTSIDSLLGRVGLSQQAPELIGLPFQAGSLYRGQQDADLLAADRVATWAPRRVSLPDDPGSPPSLPVDEPQRVKTMVGTFAGWPSLLAEPREPVVGVAPQAHVGPGPGKAKPWNTSTDPVAAVLTAAWDPGLARWLGLMWTDSTNVPTPSPTPAAWLYAVSGLWAVDPVRPLYEPRWPGDKPPRLLDRLPASSDPVGEIARVCNEVAGLDKLVADLQSGGLAIMPLTAMIGAAIAATPDLPDPPVLTGARQGPWKGGVSGGPARRTVALAFATAPPGTLALARDGGGAPVTLHRQLDQAQPWRAAIGVGRPTDGSLPIEVRDENAPDGPSIYLVARSDAFGRWSPWSTISGPASEHPPVPIPQLQVTAHPPPDVVPATEDPLPTLVRVEVAVPLTEQIEPGAFPVRRVGLSLDGGVTQWFDLALPEQETFVIPDVVGASLGPAQTVSVTFAAQFQDEQGRLSNWSVPFGRRLYDPRPPAHIIPSGPLHYAGRPGRDGLARATIDWIALDPTVRYRLYLAYEPELRARLASSGNAAVLQALDQADGTGQRAAVYFGNAAALPQDAFHLITPVPVEPAGGSGTFTHPLPGGLPGLAVFRINPMSEALVEADPQHAPVVVYAVPDERAPSAPILRVRTVPTGVEATIESARGTRPLSGWRLRRRRNEVSDAVFMPVVLKGTIPPVPLGSDAPAVTGLDAIKAAPDATDRWTYVAEVQGSAEDAAVERPDRPTPWSPPSRPASIVLVPPAPPPPITGGTAKRSVASPTQVTIAVTHPGRLTSGLDRPYRIDAYRVTDPAVVLQLAVSLDADASVAAGGRASGTPGPFTLIDPQGAGAIAYQVVVVDPLGRSSDPISVAVTAGA